MSTTRLEIEEMVEGQTNGFITFNEAIAMIDALCQPKFIEIGLATPPSSPSIGDTYVVGTSATGVWTSLDGKIAVYIGGWRFIDTKEGFIGWDVVNGYPVVWNGSAWKEITIVP